MKFEKYHGLGNDFLITEYENYNLIKNMSEFIKSICSRHIGFGADGVIFVKKDPLEMVIYNADGSRAEMCGNGIRCFSKYCIDHNIVTSSEFMVNTLDGIKKVIVKSIDPFICLVNLGTAKKEIKQINLNINNKEINGYFINLGVPHYVVFNNYYELGNLICHNEAFPHFTNVDYCEVKSVDNIKVTTYERGVGPTLACGTGSCASVIVCMMLGKVSPIVKVDLALGSLNISIKNNEIYMEGKAERIGIIDIDSF